MLHLPIRVAATAVAVVSLLSAALSSPLPAAAADEAAEPQVIRLDGQSSGRVFDGIGALSAGASSRLLADYPQPQRDRILDYLFKPGYGASLQTLRVEIGGDVNSTQGAEPSHMRRPDTVDCDRGYEWWLMREARRRNPGIVLSGLSWGAPGWFDGGFWSDDNIDHLVAWLGCARRHGLTIDYLGGWNESETFDPAWFVRLKRALRAHGYEDTGIIAADGWGSDVTERWKVADVMAADPDFRDAVDVLSVHYACGPQYNGAPYDHCPSTGTARSLGKPLWSGEQGSQKYDIGAAPLAKAINRSYIDGRMTSTVNWAMSASAYTSIPYAGVGLMRAYQPWSGYFEASKSLWSVAHTTQFARPGWRYLDEASGYLDTGGSYVTLKAPDSGDYSTVVETIDATGPQTVRLDVAGGLADGPVHVWESDMRSGEYADWFRRAGTIRPTDGSYEVTLQPGRIYTLSTTDGQGKPAAGTGGADRTMRLLYTDGFETTPVGRSPHLLSDFNGAFEAMPCPAGRPGRCIGQAVTTRPIDWRYTTRTTPLATLGDPNWSGDYTVGMDVRVDDAPYVDLLGRVDGVQLGQGGQPGYRMRLARDGRWTLIEYAPNRVERTLATGRIAAFAPGRWYRLRLGFHGTEITAYVDGRRVATARDDRHDRGQVGVVVGDWSHAQFDNLTVRPTGPAPRLIPQDELGVTATSAGLGNEAANVLDQNPNSMWQTPATSPLPQAITLDLGRLRSVRQLLYTPRYDGNPAGTITSYRVSVSTDGRTFTPAGQGTWPAGATTKAVALPRSPIRYVRLEAVGGGGAAGAAELNVAR